jgi:uncharacterized protein (TIGR03089 family)
MTTTPADVLDRRLRLAPADPLITWYDERTGERTELSAVTFANWVAKSANLLRDGLGLGGGDRVALALPTHWQAAPLAHAVWRLDAIVAEPHAAAGPVELLITGGTLGTGGDETEADEVLALALRPLGLPGEPPTDGAHDYDRDIRIHGDRFDGPRNDPAAPGYLDAAGRALSQAELVERATRSAQGQRPLLALGPQSGADQALVGLIGALCPDGVVVVVGGDDERLQRIATAERATSIVR